MHACTHDAVIRSTIVMVFVPIGHSKRPSLSHSVSQIGVHLVIQLVSSMQNSYLVVVCCFGVLISVYENGNQYTPILVYDDGVCCCLHVMNIHCKKPFLTQGSVLSKS